MGVKFPSRKTLSILIYVYKMENMRMTELRALARERELRGYSKLRKAELIAFLRDNERNQPTRTPPRPVQSGAPLGGSVPRTHQELSSPTDTVIPLTKRQHKHKGAKDTKLAKKFVDLNSEINALKLQMEELKEKISHASKSAHSSFKRKKIRTMKREVDKISAALEKSEACLESMRVPKDPVSGVPLKLHPRSRPKHIEVKIAELNKKIRRAKGARNKQCLIARRETLCAELNWGPRRLEGAFGGAYRRYRIDGLTGMDPDTFFNRVRSFLFNLLRRESRTGAVHSQSTTWIRFRKDGEMVELAFNSRMLNVYSLSNMNEIVNAMISHMKQQIENPALSDSKFVFDEVVNMDVNFYRLNLMRGSSYLPLPDWLARKKATINPKNSDLECSKWAVIAAMRWEEIGKNPEQIAKLKRFENDFDWTGVGFPVSFRTIKRFESQNQISMNVLAVEDRQIYICRKGGDYDRVVNLMLKLRTIISTM